MGRVAERMGVWRETLERELRSSPRPAGSPPPPAPGADGASRGRAARAWNRAEAALLRILLAAPEWRSRARHDVPEEWFEVPAYQAIYHALTGLPDQADAGDVAAGLGEAELAEFDRLRESAEALAGLQFDQEYAAAADKLRDRAEFRRLGQVRDPAERRRIMDRWSRETKQRYSWFRAAQRGRSPRRT